jgi:hypothetical protein
MIAERKGSGFRISTVASGMRCDRIGLPGIGQIDRTDGNHLGRGMVRCCRGNHDHGGDAAEAWKRQALDQLFVGHDFVGARLQLAFDALDPERMPECHRFASRPRQDQHPRVARASADSTRIEPLSRAFASFCCKSSVRSVGTKPWTRRLKRTGITLRFLGPKSHDFVFTPRCAPVCPRSDTPDH